MGHKKYYGYKPKHEHYEVTFWADKGKEGIALYFIYDDGECGMNKYYWSTDMDYERNKRGEVEANYFWDKENTKKLMLRTGTHSGKDMVAAIYERFKQYKDCANTHICDWCDEKGIEYKKQVWW